jgi:hypothetical protein
MVMEIQVFNVTWKLFAYYHHHHHHHHHHHLSSFTHSLGKQLYSPIYSSSEKVYTIQFNKSSKWPLSAWAHPTFNNIKHNLKEEL